MNPQVFNSRKSFLSNFLTEKVEFSFSDSNSPFNESIYITNYFNSEVYSPDFISQKIKPFYYYILSYYEKHSPPSNITFSLKPHLNDYEDSYIEFTHFDFFYPDTSYTLKSIAHFNFSLYKIKDEGFFTIPIYPFFFEIKITSEPIVKNEICKTYKTNECVICLSSSSNIIYTDCGHISTCENCELKEEITLCPICRTITTKSKFKINF